MSCPVMLTTYGLSEDGSHKLTNTPIVLAAISFSFPDSMDSRIMDSKGSIALNNVVFY